MSDEQWRAELDDVKMMLAEVAPDLAGHIYSGTDRRVRSTRWLTRDEFVLIHRAVELVYQRAGKTKPCLDCEWAAYLAQETDEQGWLVVDCPHRRGEALEPGRESRLPAEAKSLLGFRTP